MADSFDVARVESVPGWRVEWRSGTAGALHDAPMSDEPVPAMWVCEPTRAALVLGSTQPVDASDASVLDAGGIDLVRRRSGGGAVLLVPGRCTWVDLVVPAGHRLWDDDVGRATHWVGEWWAGALARLGIATAVHRGPMLRTAWSARVCFAGVGPGEVLDRSGRKLVGVSQRRTRRAARFQTVAYHDTDPSEVADLVGLDPVEAAALRESLRVGAGAVESTPVAVVAALMDTLPA